MEDYQLLAINENGEIVNCMTFANWVTISEAIETLREFNPETIGILNARNFSAIWAAPDYGVRVTA